MKCIRCMDEVWVGTKVVVIPFPAAGENCYLVAHAKCCPKALEVETNEVGYFLQGSGRFFVPSARIADLEA